MLMSVLKSGTPPRLDIIANVKKKLPQILADVPYKIQGHFLADQSIFVRASINGVIREGAIAAVLTGSDDPGVPGSWRSTLIIAVSIPLSVLASLIVLSALGETINIMTLGGLALAVGILVDDATVEVENINRNIDQGKEIIQAILDGASQIAVPALVSTLSICIVFVPMFFLLGCCRNICSCRWRKRWFSRCWPPTCLSRTLVPTMARFLLVAQTGEGGHHSGAKASRNPFVRMQASFETGFERFRERYRGLLEACHPPSQAVRGLLLPGLHSFVCAAAFYRAGLFPDRRQRRIQVALAGADGNAN